MNEYFSNNSGSSEGGNVRTSNDGIDENKNLGGISVENTYIAGDESTADDSRDNFAYSAHANNDGEYRYYKTQDREDTGDIYGSPAKKTKRSKPGFGKKAVSVVCAALVFGGVSGGTFYAINSGVFGGSQQEIVQSTQPVQEQIEQTTISNTVSEEAFTVAQVAENALPSVVAITNKSVQEVQSIFGQTGQYVEAQSNGSGVIIGENDENLFIATNYHVVEGSTSLTVAFGDETVAQAEYKGGDASNDLAVISVKKSDISAETMDYIKVIAIGDSEELIVGEQVVAIGNALGYGQSVTSGYVSALDREITTDNQTTLTVLQTDTAINPGNSGGALLNMQGELIGINSAKTIVDNVEGMGYAIPVDHAHPILDEIVDRPDAVAEEDAGYLGVIGASVDAQAAELYNVPKGAFIESVEQGTPAMAAGLQAGDIIVAIDEYDIESFEDLAQTMSYYPAGSQVTVTVMRPGEWEYEQLSVTATLTAKPQTQSIPE